MKKEIYVGVAHIPSGGLMGTTVELDSRGRLLLPAEIRKRLGSRRFLLKESDGALKLEPLPRAEEVRGKYKGLIKKSMEDLEEDQERFLEEGGR